MKVVKAPIETVPENRQIASMTPLFGPETIPDGAVNMGYAVFEPGVRVPPEGRSSHEGDEFSYIISGSLKCTSGSEQFETKAGDAIYIPAGEQHYSSNESDSPCRLIYMLVKSSKRQ
jgi:quercetin dioxygenase-like cupin family protein